MKVPNRMDSRNRSAFDIVADLKKEGGFKLAILGTHRVDASELAAALPDAVRAAIPDKVWEDRKRVTRIITGCADGGTEKAARLAAKAITGGLAVVFHRAEMTYGKKPAEEMRDNLIAQEADALVVVTSGKKTCSFVRERFGVRGKKVYEIEIG